MFAERVQHALRQRKGDEDGVPILLGFYDGHVLLPDSQLHIWHMNQLVPESSAYNVTAAGETMVSQPDEGLPSRHGCRT